ncbi:MAG: hypothetical protein HC897_15055 [Thermoanaerobaculia bacterium]|nr:hypothetical protein [Thermoanaerobaculia bacterium]
MADHIIDTNVLLVASAANSASPFTDSDLPGELQTHVLNWLTAFRLDTTRAMVWDTTWTIYSEYRRKLTDQDYGLQVVHEKLDSARFVAIELDDDSNATVPVEFSSFDRSDRKFLAVLLADEEKSTLINATDTDWLEIEDDLRAAGVTVEHLLEDWLRTKRAEKKSR